MSYGSKPSEIRHPQAALLAEGYVGQRIQSLGYTADLNSEEVSQLTDPNVVEVVDADPTVSLTIDINEFGSINLYNQLAGFYGFPENAVTVGHRYPASVYEAFATIDNTNHHDGTISHSDFGEVATDFMVVIKDSETATAQSRALWFSNCYIDSISGSYQVDGFASESISLTGSQQMWFLNDYKSARVEKATYIASGADTGDLDITVSGGFFRLLTEDGLLLPAGYYSAGVSTFSPNGGYSFKADSRYRFIHIPIANSFPNITNDGGSPIGGVKEGELELLMWDGTHFGSAEPLIGGASIADQKMLRVQSVDYEIAYDREDLKQLYTGTYYKGLNDTNITASITVNDSDLELWAIGTGNYADWTDSGSVDYYSLSDFQNMSSVQLRIDVFNTKTAINHSASTLLKSIRLHDGKVTSVSETRDVPGRGSVTVDVTFKRMNYYGTGLWGRS